MAIASGLPHTAAWAVATWYENFEDYEYHAAVATLRKRLYVRDVDSIEPGARNSHGQRYNAIARHDWGGWNN